MIPYKKKKKHLNRAQKWIIAAAQNLNTQDVYHFWNEVQDSDWEERILAKETSAGRETEYEYALSLVNVILDRIKSANKEKRIKVHEIRAIKDDAIPTGIFVIFLYLRTTQWFSHTMELHVSLLLTFNILSQILLFHVV